MGDLAVIQHRPLRLQPAWDLTEPFAMVGAVLSLIEDDADAAFANRSNGAGLSTGRAFVQR